jgi:homoserine dehydrogenase
VAVRDLGRAERSWVPRHLLVRDPAALVEREADVVVELFGGIEPARSLIVRALELGRAVVTANKALLAEEIGPLSRLASRRGVALRCSASVGGALPALEAVRRAALSGRIEAVSGVLNGTCNYILDRIGEGMSLDEAVAAAQEAGFAEADPLLDLDGSDAAQKLALLAREAFGTALDWRRIPRRGLTGLDRSVLDAVARRGRAVRLVASCERTAAGLRASVQPLEIPLDHPFARLRGADNALRIEHRSGETLDLTARGAGRWPTTEAVFADLYDLLAERSQAGRSGVFVGEEVVA